MPFSDLVSQDLGVGSFKSSPCDSNVQPVIQTSAALDPATQSVSLGLAALRPPGSLLATQHLRPIPDPLDQNLHLTRPPRDSALNFEQSCSRALSLSNLARSLPSPGSLP